MLSSTVPKFHKVTQWAQVDATYTLGLCHICVTLSLGSLSLCHQSVSKPVLCLEGAVVISYKISSHIKILKHGPGERAVTVLTLWHITGRHARDPGKTVSQHKYLVKLTAGQIWKASANLALGDVVASYCL